MQDGVLRNTLVKAGLDFQVPEQTAPVKSGGLFALFRRSVPQETAEPQTITSHKIGLQSEAPKELKNRLSNVVKGLQTTQTLITGKQEGMKRAFSKGGENRSAVVKEIESLASVWQAEQKKIDHLITVAESNKEIKGTPDLKVLKEHQAAINKQFIQIQSELVTQEKANLKTLQDTILKPFQRATDPTGGELKKVFNSLRELARIDASVTNCIPNKETQAILKTIADERTKTEQAILKTLNAENSIDQSGNILSKYWMQILVGETIPISPKLDQVLNHETRPKFNEFIVQAAFVKAENQERLSRGEVLIDKPSEEGTSVSDKLTLFTSEVMEHIDNLTDDYKLKKEFQEVFRQDSNLITRNAYGLDKQVFSDNLLVGIGGGVKQEGDGLDSGTAGRQQKFDSSALDALITKMPQANQPRARALQSEGYRPLPITPHIWRQAGWQKSNFNEAGKMPRAGDFVMSLAIPGEIPVKAHIPLDLSFLKDVTTQQTRYIMTVIHATATAREGEDIKALLESNLQQVGKEADPTTNKPFFEEDECIEIFATIYKEGVLDELTSAVENLFHSIDYETNHLFYEVSSTSPEKALREILGEAIVPPSALQQIMFDSPEVNAAMDSYLKQAKGLRDLNLVRVSTNRAPISGIGEELMLANMALNDAINQHFSQKHSAIQNHLDFIQEWTAIPLTQLDQALDQLSAQTALVSDNMRVKVALSSLVAYGKSVQHENKDETGLIRDDVDLMVLVDILQSAFDDSKSKIDDDMEACNNFISQIISTKLTGASPQMIAETMLQDVSDLAQQTGNVFKTKFDRAVYSDAKMEMLAAKYPEYRDELEGIIEDSRYELNASARYTICFQNPPTLKRQKWLEKITADGKPDGPFKAGVLQADLKLVGKKEPYKTEPMRLDLSSLYELQNLNKAQADAVLEVIVKSVDAGEYDKKAMTNWSENPELQALQTPEFEAALIAVATEFVQTSGLAIGQVMLKFGG